jgi:predicted CoA-substrate-specific enzyme activase
MVTCGLDIGSRTIAAALFNGAEVIETIVVDTGSRPTENAKDALSSVLSAAGLDRGDVSGLVATGYGRNYFDDADRVASEILCHARGVSFLFPAARTVVDIGGQDSKMISLGAEGKVVNFVMNDRCAAGTGKFMEMVARTLGEPLENIGALAAGSTDICEISSMCAVFAESEIIGLIQSGTPLASVLRGVFHSVARRTLSMSGRVGLVPDVVFTGGVARNEGVVRALEEEGGVSLLLPYDPQITGALGAALIAAPN